MITGPITAQNNAKNNAEKTPTAGKIFALNQEKMIVGKVPGDGVLMETSGANTRNKNRYKKAGFLKPAFTGAYVADLRYPGW